MLLITVERPYLTVQVPEHGQPKTFTLLPVTLCPDPMLVPGLDPLALEGQLLEVQGQGHFISKIVPRLATDQPQEEIDPHLKIKNHF